MDEPKDGTGLLSPLAAQLRRQAQIDELLRQAIEAAKTEKPEESE